MFKEHWSVGDWYSRCMTVLCVHALSLYRWQCEQQNCSRLPDRETNNQRLFLTFSCSLSSSSAVRLVGGFRSDAVCCCCSFWFPLAGRQNKHIWLQTFTNVIVLPASSCCLFHLSLSCCSAPLHFQCDVLYTSHCRTNTRTFWYLSETQWKPVGRQIKSKIL